ncbi:alanine--glyoxylate aminotransferase 2 [Anaeramoeba flamelloides]|uniref:alanine--glyoxylate transaminase n=1 Tax=Anaeramoeba flamelloides TaxID=1746091 RepID=A0AAV8AEF8_9EUKA|nr:alanine--glyoxylate aminotransferase 2 [Anaeramoeba flamelloides]
MLSHLATKTPKTISPNILGRIKRNLRPLPPFDFKPAPYYGPSKEQVLKDRLAHVHPSVLLYYEKPIMIVQGQMQYLFDEKGKRYLDGIAGIVTVSVGHSHPRVIEAAKKQLEKLAHTTTIYLHPNITEYCKLLASKLPKKLSHIYLVNSGTEANELATQMSRLHTGNYDMVALRNCYHGMGAAMGLTAHSTWKQPVPQGFGIKHALNPDLYQGAFREDDPNAVEKYLKNLEHLILTGTAGQVAGYIAEPIQGVGGAVVMPKGYLKNAYKIIRSHGGVCISDEVQTGFGRTGESYWGFQKDDPDLVPDIVTMAKGIGNGQPMGAVATTKEIAQSMSGAIHFNTFGGNPVSCTIGQAVLEVIEEDGLQENCRVTGSYLIKELKRLQRKHNIIGQVRGKGLMVGVELVKDRKTREPASAETKKVAELMKDNGVLIAKGGLYGNVIRIKPPMCFNKLDVDFLVDVLDYSLSKL